MLNYLLIIIVYITCNRKILTINSIKINKILLSYRMWKRKSNRINEYNNAQRGFLHSLNSIVGLEQLLENISIKLCEIVDASNIYFILFEPVTNHYVSRGIKSNNDTSFAELIFSSADNLIKWLNVNRTILNVDKNVEVVKFLSVREQTLLEKINVKLIVPLFIVERLTGVLLIGKKNNNENYNTLDLDLLSMLADQSALAIEHAIMYRFQEDKLKKLFHTDKLATIGELAAGAAHEIRNPLTFIRSSVQLLQKELNDAKKAMGESIIEEIDRIDKIINGLLSFSKAAELQISNVNIREIIDQVLSLLETEIRKNNVEIDLRNLLNQKEIIVPGDSLQLKQVFLNILLNSIQAIKDGGIISIGLFTDSTNERAFVKDFVKIIVKDNGIGIAENDLQKVIDPFYTTKENGTGLGLSISYGIITKHGGDIEIKSKTSGDDRGTTVIVRLPLT